MELEKRGEKREDDRTGTNEVRSCQIFPSRYRKREKKKLDK